MEKFSAPSLVSLLVFIEATNGFQGGIDLFQLPPGGSTSRETADSIPITAPYKEAAFDSLYPVETMPGQDFQPRVVFDGGAFQGIWSYTAHKNWPDAHYIMVEASACKEVKLRDTAERFLKGNYSIYINLLGEKEDEELPFFEGAFHP